MNKYEGVKINSIISVYDGDSFRGRINAWPAVFGENCPFRLNGLDTPERGWRAKSQYEADLAEKARELVQSKLSAAIKITADVHGMDSRSRVLVTVYADGENINKLLIDNGLAYEYHGGTKRSWSIDEPITKVST